MTINNTRASGDVQRGQHGSPDFVPVRRGVRLRRRSRLTPLTSRRHDAGTAAAAAAAPDIVVTGQRVEYGVRSTSTATKTATSIRNIPQALTIVSESQIEDQQLRSVADLLNFVPGASYGSGEGNRDQIVLRGNSSTADFFVDGVRDDVQYFRDFYNVDRVEVLKGPNAMIFGRGGGGGIVNRVLKRPSLSAYRQLTASGDGSGLPPDRRRRSAAWRLGGRAAQCGL